ncbi:MAG: type I secretion system permease/ATPase [Pseudomonadota bacterium]
MLQRSKASKPAADAPGADRPQPAGHAVDGFDPVATDHVLACLGFVAAQAGLPFSPAAASSNLPLVDGRLTPELVARAAANLGMEAQVFQRKPSEVPALVAPFIVLFDRGDACVVTDVSPIGKFARVVFPAVSDKPRRVRLKKLDKQASNYVIYVSAGADQLPGHAEDKKPARHWLLSPLFRFWPVGVQVALAALVINILGLALPLFIMNVYDRVIQTQSMPTLWALTAGVAIAIAFDFILKLMRGLLLDGAGKRVDLGVNSTLFEQAMSARMSARAAPSGVLANQIKDFENAREFLTSSLLVGVIDLAFIGIFLAVLWLVAGSLALIPLIAVPLVLAVTLLLQIPLSRSIKRTHGLMQNRHGMLVEALTGVEAVKAAGGEGYLQGKWEQATAASVRASAATRLWASIALNFTGLVQQGVSVAIIVWGVFLIGAGELTIGGLIAANILAGRILAPLANIAMSLSRSEFAFASLRALGRFMKLERDDVVHKHAGGEIGSAAIEFRDVSLSYPQSPRPALQGINLSIQPGERIGIIGRIGSGKSTLGRLMGALVSPSEGSVLIDGLDARQYAVGDVRSAIGYLDQEPHLFSGTIRENIVLGRPHASDREVLEAVHLAGLDALVAGHPMGLAAPVAERGRNLSGGQRHHVVLARLLVRKPKVLFLDEPSAAMDTAAENHLMAQLARLPRETTTLVIATHRASLLALVDRLVVVEDGRLIADGPRDDVLNKLKQNQAAVQQQVTGAG